MDLSSLSSNMPISLVKAVTTGLTSVSTENCLDFLTDDTRTSDDKAISLGAVLSALSVAPATIIMSVGALKLMSTKDAKTESKYGFNHASDNIKEALGISNEDMALAKNLYEKTTKALGKGADTVEEASTYNIAITSPELAIESFRVNLIDNISVPKVIIALTIAKLIQGTMQGRIEQLTEKMKSDIESAGNSSHTPKTIH